MATGGDIKWGYELLQRLAKEFDGSEIWFQKVKRLLVDSKQKETTKFCSISRLRREIIQRDFNSYYGENFSHTFGRCSLNFPTEALNWYKLAPLDRYKLWCFAKQQSIREIVKPESFEHELSQVDYCPGSFAKLRLDMIIPGSRERRMHKQQSRQNEKFEAVRLMVIENPNQLMQKVLNPLRLREITPADILPALLLATGLRVSDIYFGAELVRVIIHDPVTNENKVEPYQAHVTSRLKPGLKSEKKGIIPLLAYVEDVLYHLARFRGVYNNVKTSSAAASSRSKKNKEWCIRAVGSLCTNFTRPHNLRALYAKLAYHVYGFPDKHEPSFVKDILLHDTFQAGTCYSNVILKTQPSHPGKL